MIIIFSAKFPQKSFRIMVVLFQVVGSQARILYSDQEGRVSIALAFNDAIKAGIIKVCSKKLQHLKMKHF